ncbi:GldG family protein [Nitrospira sp. BLG_1]|uniref:GldG family protein n=1 Tax=Nitrospira sp. BLG_1 TaxID=3395883 RepID=UPI0039BC2C4F
MKLQSFPLGIVGILLGIGGMVAYSLRPDWLWAVTVSEGLALACLVSFFVLHFETVKAFSGRRSTKMGLNSLLMVVFFTSILVIVNFLAARHSVRWDLSENQNYTLAPQTYRVLRTLPRDVKITVFTREKDPGYQSFKERLESYRQASTKLSVEFIDPEKQPKMAQTYGIFRTDTAIFESNGQTIRVTSPSEIELTGALIRISKDSKKRIVFVEGHSELNVEDKDRNGLFSAKEALIRQGYDVGTVSLLKESAVPDHTSVLVLAGPRRPVMKEEQDRIHSYVEKGGHLLLLADPDTQTGLETLLARWGVGLGPGVLVDLQDRLAQGDLTALLVRTFTEHEITQDLTSAVLLPLSRHITFDEQTGTDWDFVPLARTSPNSWAETNMQGRVVSLSEKEDVKGPLPMAAALSPKKAPEEGKPRPAIVVIGNSTFASNAFFNFPGNSDFFLHTTGWLAEERDLISIAPREPALHPFTPNPTQERALIYIQVVLLPLMTFLTGLIVWRKRRRL